MQDITNFIENFAKKYSTIEAIQTQDFEKDLQTLGDALVKRVEFEENELYKYYEDEN